MLYNVECKEEHVQTLLVSLPTISLRYGNFLRMDQRLKIASLSRTINGTLQVLVDAYLVRRRLYGFVYGFREIRNSAQADIYLTNLPIRQPTTQL